MGLFNKKQAAPDLQAVEQAFLELKARSLKEQLAGVDRSALFDAELGVYQRWYFEFRLEEEVARATRYDESFALWRARYFLMTTWVPISFSRPRATACSMPTWKAGSEIGPRCPPGSARP